MKSHIFWSLLKKDFLDLLRSKKILILGIIFLFVAISSVVLAKVMPQILNSLPQTPGLTISLPTPTYLDSVDQFVKNLSQLAIFVLVFLVAGTVVDEKTKKTLELTLTKPISKKAFILSKYAANLGSIKVVYLISALIFYFYTVTTFASFSFINFLIMSLLILVYLILISSATIFFSTIASSPIMAAIGGFVSMIILGTVWGLIKSIKNYSPYKLVGDYKEIITSGWNKDLLFPLLISIVLIISFVWASIIVFQKQEIER
ncbi:TPA: hypothetical protein DD449_01190 [Candidatus Berkelbacteria bacterium]|uniref:ABC transporter permease n=1 Tax=Berkelbacteria bacterium GW2011_GWE1_39_12 TaxID=1618337 RepID=A0A0G4B3T9_9BACT|nr:MAG: hypothetical protein UT28_C0001G0849 [Berkelbacteria bacterium GW2011_GWE1_39_12]HBO60287.1 hypothetical protein [Candidatus Berkelbacteria bacterium]